MEFKKYFTENISGLKNNSDKISLDRKTFVQKILPNLILRYNKNNYRIQTEDSKFCATVRIIRKPNGLQRITESTP
jgi:hypothetical protein